MTAPTSPLDKKETISVEKELTLEERVGRLEIVIENAFNALAKGIHESEIRLNEERVYLEKGLSQTLNMINLTILQNIVTIRELTKVLVEKELVDAKDLEEKVQTSLKEALELQRKVLEEAQAAAVAQQTEQTSEETKA